MSYGLAELAQPVGSDGWNCTLTWVESPGCKVNEITCPLARIQLLALVPPIARLLTVSATEPVLLKVKALGAGSALPRTEEKTRRGVDWFASIASSGEVTTSADVDAAVCVQLEEAVPVFSALS